MSDFEFIKFLEGRNYTFLRNGLIRAPSADHVETQDEAEALDELFHEWDFADEPRALWQPNEKDVPK